MKKSQVQVVINDLNKRMSAYTHSAHPTNDEVALALLIAHIADLDKELDKLKGSISEWWKEHEFDTMGAMGDHNVYDEDPPFITLAAQEDTE